MQIDEERKERQLLGVQKWKDNKYNGVLDWHTGVGKTFGASLAIKLVEEEERSTYLIIFNKFSYKSFFFCFIF